MPHGKICYVEIPSKDAQTSADFYSKVFGWKVRKRGDGHLAFDDESGYVSGSWAPKKSSNDATLTYVMVDSIEESLREIVAGGGRVVTPYTDIGSGTGFAIFEDPAGTRLGLYEEPQK